MRGIDGMYISTSLSIDQRGLSHLDPSIQANVVVESKFKAKCEDGHVDVIDKTIRKGKKQAHH